MCKTKTKIVSEMTYTVSSGTLNSTIPYQDQDHSLQDQDQDRFFWSQTGLVLRPSVSDHITGSKGRGLGDDNATTL